MEQATLDLAGCVANSGATALVAARGGRLEGALAATGARLLRLPLDSKNPAVIVANGVRLARLIDKERVSLVHVRSRAPAFSAVIAARMAAVPLVATYHGAYRAHWPAKRWYNRIMTAGDLVFANSEFIAAHIAAEHPRAAAKIALVREGIDFGRFDPDAVSAERIDAQRRAWRVAPGESRPLVLIAARLAASKGQALALAALALMPPSDRPILVLAGEAARPGGRRALELEAARLGLTDHVRLPGACDDMPAALLAADFLAAPSTVPESFGRAVVEAAAMGRPAIASRLGALAETIVEGRTGWLVDAPDPGPWAQALARALAAPAQQRRAMGAAARERAVRLYSLSGLCAATFAAYRGIVDRRG